MTRTKRSFTCAEARWAAVGPYYAMFPTDFADQVVREYSERGDVVLDPFAGRGTALYSAATQGRVGIGIEINPVGWVYSKAKLQPARKSEVLHRLREIEAASVRFADEADLLPEFFRCCYSRPVRRFLVASRSMLNWRRSRSDWTTAALMLVYLHGKRGQALSNQMRQTKAMSPPYAIRWWRRFNHEPPELCPVEFMAKRIEWRYAKGVPAVTRSFAYLGDSTDVLHHSRHSVAARKGAGVSLLFTSPPYWGVTNYFYDQWLRLWLLGYPAAPRRNSGTNRSRFADKRVYKDMLWGVMAGSAKLLCRGAVVYIRTDARASTLDTTMEVLGSVFPGKSVEAVNAPCSSFSQTQLFGNQPSKVGEVDLIIRT